MTEPNVVSTAVEPERPLVRRIIEETSRFAMLQVVMAAIGWGANIALARLLERRDFGVFGIASFYIGIGTLLGSGGLGATLLRRKGGVNPEEYQSTVTAMMAIAMAFALALFFFAPYIGAANGFSTAEINVLRAMAPLYFVGALRITPYVRLERELSFSSIARIELVAAIVKHAVALAIAAAYGSVWALVLSQLASAVVQLGLAYRVSPGWAGLGFSWTVFRPLFAYGSKVQSLSIFAYFKDNISRSLLGTTHGAATVGIFDFAIQYIQVPIVAVNGLARVQLPVYAQLDRDDPDLYVALRGAMRIALLLGIPLLAMLAFGGPWLVGLIYGEKWLPSVPIAWALVINMVCSLVTSPLFTLLEGQGRAGLAVIAFAVWTLSTWALSVAVLLVDLHRLELVGWCYSIATLGVTVYLLGWAARHLRRPILPDLMSPVIAGALAFALTFAIRFLASGALTHPLSLALSSLAIYAVTLVAIDGPRVRREGRALVQNVLRTPRKPPPTEVKPQ
jgi:O-antigen/teichoic acid export membrane protein